MAKFCEWRDLFKWNKQLMEDDWNDGQAYVVKYTQKGDDCELTTTAKVAEAKSDAHKVDAEQKLKWTSKGTEQTGPFEMEAKLKNNGQMSGDVKSDFLKSYEGFENVRLLLKGTYNTGAKPMQLGWSLMNNDVKLDHYVDTSKDYGTVMNMTWQAAPWLIVGATKKWDSIMDPMNKVTWSMGFAGHFEKSLQWGLNIDGASPTVADTTVKSSTLYFNHAAGAKTVGAEMKYDVAKKAFGCKVGLKMDQGDHLWKLRLHDSGIARAALQWQMHKVCKTTLDTTLDVKQVLHGSVTSVPIGLTFEVKY